MECEAVSSIVGESNFFFDDSTRKGWMKIDVNVPPEGLKVSSSRNEVATFEHLPPITLDFVLQDSYPSSSPPQDLQIHCDWLSIDQVTNSTIKQKQINCNLHIFSL